MKDYKIMFRLLICSLILSAATAATAQTVANPTNLATPQMTVKQNDGRFETTDYSFALPNETWRSVSAKDASNADLIYGDRSDGFLQIRKITMTQNITLADVIDREQNQKLQFLNNFVNGREENFKGVLNGKVANYEFTQSGKAMGGRAYFLQIDEKTIYVLRFTGERDKLRVLRNQTDSIARTFKLKNEDKATAK